MRGVDFIKEILAGDHFENALARFGVVAECTYKMSDKAKETQPYLDYHVWELSDEEYEKLNSIKDSDWYGEEEIFNACNNTSDGFGWWRWAEGCNIRLDDDFILMDLEIHGCKLKAFYDIENRREFIKHVWCETLDEFDAMSVEEYEEACANYDKSHTVYHNLIQYCCDAVGVSTEKNICAVTSDIARINKMKLSELFERTIG